MISYNGIAVSSGIARSRAKVLNDVNDFVKVEEGDIIIVYKSYPGWVIPLIKASGMICEIGGALSHIGILCRESGKPCVSGIPDICSIIKDGDDVMIDGNKGVVYVYK